MKKHPQSILAVEASHIIAQLELAEAFTPVAKVSFQQFLEVAQPLAIFQERDRLDNAKFTSSSVENMLSHIAALHGMEITIDRDEELEFQGDRTKLQLLPYVYVIETRDGVEYIHNYARTSKVGEQRLAGNISVGWGGHIDMDDAVTSSSVLSLGSTINISMMRELEEEMQLLNESGQPMPHSMLSPVFQGLILDYSNAVGHLHLGLAFCIRLPENWTVKTNEDELVTRAPVSLADFRAGKIENMESWTQILATQV